MAVQLSELTRRVGVTVVGLVVAVGLVAGCSSSGSGHPNSNNTSTNTTSGGAATTPAGGNSSSTSGGGGGANPFCSGYTPLQVSGLNSASNMNDVVKAWDNYAKNAPSEIKPQAQAIAKYLHDYQDKNYGNLSADAQKIGTDLQQIGTYISTHCAK